MKKAQTITAFTLLAVSIWMRFYAPINRVALILRHISLFLLMGIGAYALTTAIFKKFMMKYKPTGAKENALYVGRVASFGVIITLFSLFQFNYIEFSETPQVEGCQYYDEYKNAVYQSKFYGSCPNLNIITNNEGVLEFSVKEYTDSREAATLVMDESTLKKNDHFELEVFSTIRIEYYNDTKVKKIDNKVTYISEINGDENLSTFYSYHKTVENFFDSGYSSTVQEAEITLAYESNQVLNLEHFDFTDDDYSTTRYYLVEGYEFIEGYLDNIDTISYELHKDFATDNNIIVSEKIANLYSIEEDGKTTYTILPYNLTYNNWMYQDVDDIRFDVLFEEDETIWSSEGSNSAADFTSQRIYDRNEDNLLKLNKFEFFASYLSDPNYLRILEYRIQLQDSNKYVYSQNVSGPVQFPGDYSNGLFSLIDTDYGTRVESLRFRTQSYFNYLINGEESYIELYYEWDDPADGFSFYKLFNIEFELIEFENYDSIFYKEPLYFTYD